MSTSKPSLGDRFYAGLLRLLPFDFRSEFGGEMEEVFREQRAETAGRRGPAALAKMWATTVGDIFRMAPREHLSVLAQDARYALRMMRRNLGYTVAAVLILGLGIGVNTSMFSAVYNVLLKPLPYLQGDDLVVVRQPALKTGVQNIGFSVHEIEDLRQRNHSLSGLVEYHAMNFTLFGGAEPRRVRTGVVSANFFDFFGVKPVMGRAFVADDDRLGAPAVLLVSYEYWRKMLGGDPNIVGRVFQMNDRPHTVVGVLPPIPQYPNENDVYMPTSACPTRSSPGVIASRTFRMMSLFGRMKPNTPVEFCRRDLNDAARQMRQDNAAAYPANLGVDSSVALLRQDLTEQARPMLLVLLGAAAFVLLIACANVANLMLARMARREQELVIRTAVGAGSGRLLRQLLTESFLMALLAAAVGVAFAFGTTKLLADFSSQFTPRSREIGVDGWVLAFAALCATATTVVFGSMAALYARGDIAAGLKDGGRTSADRRRTLTRGALIAAQVAFSFILLTGAGLMVRSFRQLQSVDAGFSAQRVFAIRFNLNWAKYNDNARFRQTFHRILDRVQQQPGVAMAAVASALPMDPDFQGGRPQRFRVEGDPRTEAESPIIRATRSVTPDYFQTLGIPVIAGRSFRDDDGRQDPQVIVISRSLAAARWPHNDPIGRRLSFDNGASWYQILGVVGDVKENGLAKEAPIEVYQPLEQSPTPTALVARSVGDPAAIGGLLRRAILDADPDTAISRFETLEEERDAAVSSPRILARLFTGFAVLAFVIAVAGIASMLALWVRQRKREIGIRMALGASPGSIVGEVVRRGMVLAAIGLVVGAIGASQLTRWMKSLLFQVQPNDVATFTIVGVLLLVAALLACLAPARRASRIDPQDALRAD
jgi:putative ABC transport system permease protein